MPENSFIVADDLLRFARVYRVSNPLSSFRKKNYISAKASQLCNFIETAKNGQLLPINAQVPNGRQCNNLRRKTQMTQPSEGEVANMQDKKKKTKKAIKVQDLKPSEDPKGGMSRYDPLKDTQWILKHLQLARSPEGGGKT